MNNNIPRYSQIVIVQLRIGFNDLNSHLFNKGCVESSLCLCGNVGEDTKHFLMICPFYDNIRTTLLTRLQQLNLHVPTNHKLLLYGNNRLTPDTNLLIQEHLSAYLRYCSDIYNGATCLKGNAISSGKNDYLSPFL